MCEVARTYHIPTTSSNPGSATAQWRRSAHRTCDGRPNACLMRSVMEGAEDMVAAAGRKRAQRRWGWRQRQAAGGGSSSSR